MDHAVNRNSETGEAIGFSEQLRRFLRHNLTWFLAAGLALLALQDVFGTHGIVAMRKSQREAAQVQKEISQITEENRQMQNHIQKLKSDPATIERIAREEMGLARPGDYIFQISPKSGAPSSPVQQTPLSGNR